MLPSIYPYNYISIYPCIQAMSYSSLNKRMKIWHIKVLHCPHKSPGIMRSVEMRNRSLMAWPDLSEGRQTPGLVPSLGKEEVSSPSVCWAQSWLCPRGKNDSVWCSCSISFTSLGSITHQFPTGSPSDEASFSSLSQSYHGFGSPSKYCSCHAPDCLHLVFGLSSTRHPLIWNTIKKLSL